MKQKGLDKKAKRMVFMLFALAFSFYIAFIIVTGLSGS